MTNHNVTRRKALTGLGMALAAPYLNIRSATAQTAGEVVVYDGGGVWGAAQKAAYFGPFEKETGIRVVPAATMPVGTYRASIIAGAPAYDVINIAAGQFDRLADEGLLQPIDYSLFDKKDLESFKPVEAQKFYFPALFYSLVLGYDIEQVGEDRPQTWADMWNLEKYPGKRSLYNAGDDSTAGAVYEMALLADGVATTELYPLDMERAFASLDKIRPEILRYWAGGAEAAQLLSDGAVSMTSAWNARVSVLKQKGLPVDLSWKQAILQWDAWAVPVGAKNTGNAMKFLAFVSKPEPQARFSELIEYGPSNSRAFELLSPERAALLPGNPETTDGQVVQDYKWWGQESGNGKSNFVAANEMWQRWIAK